MYGQFSAELAFYVHCIDECPEYAILGLVRECETCHYRFQDDNCLKIHMGRAHPSERVRSQSEANQVALPANPVLEPFPNFGSIPIALGWYTVDEMAINILDVVMEELEENGQLNATIPTQTNDYANNSIVLQPGTQQYKDFIRMEVENEIKKWKYGVLLCIACLFFLLIQYLIVV